MTYRGRDASNTTYTILRRINVLLNTVPPIPTLLVARRARAMTFEDTTQGIQIGASATSATINVGVEPATVGTGGAVTFKGNSHADNAEFWTTSGIGGDSLRISNPVVIAGDRRSRHF